MSRSYRRRVLGLTWWDDDGAVDMVQLVPGRIAATVEAPVKCECGENGTSHVCRYCMDRGRKWHNPLDEGIEGDDSGYTPLDTVEGM